MKLLKYKLIFIFFAIISINLISLNIVSASTYYVRADGTAANKAAAIGPATDATASMNVTTFNAQTFSDNDIVIFSSRGGAFNNVAVVIPSGGSTFANRIIYKGESGFEPTFDGQNTTDVIVKVSSKNNLEIQALTLTRPVTSGLEVGGTSGGVIVSDIVSTYSGNQSFQNLDTASTTYRNITGSNSVDDGFSMHDSSRANIFNGTFENNDQNINTIKGTTLYAENITIRGCTHQCIYLVNTYGTAEIVTGIFKNILIENSTATGTPIYLSTHASTTFENLTIRNISSQGILNNQGLITLDADGYTELKNFTIIGNASATYLMSAILANSTTATKGKNIKLSNGLITDVNGHIIDSYEDNLTMDHVVLKNMASAKSAIVVRAGTANLKNLTIFDNNRNGNGLFVTGASSVINATNTIIHYVSTALNNSSATGRTAYTTNYGNTTASSGTWTQTNTFNVNPIFVASSTENLKLASSSPLIDAGIDVGSLGDASSSPIYGAPDIGAYEYQPPFTLGTDLVDPTGSFRIYGDKKYRYTTATSSTMLADFSVSPTEGSWTYDATSTRPEWLNISSMTWNTGGNYAKSWIATSSTATTTIYTIGNLRSNIPYIVDVDGAASTTVTTNSSGKLVYTYSGGYASAHTFRVTSDTTAPQVVFTVPSTGATIGGAAVTLTATSTDDVGVYGVRFYYGSTAIGSIVTATSSVNTYTMIWDVSNIPSGNYVLYAVSEDASGNYATSTGISVTVTDQISPNVEITAPVNGSLYTNSETVSLTASSSDNVLVRGVKIYIDSVLSGSEITATTSSNIYSSTISTTGLSAGNHTLIVVSRDSSNNYATSSSITIAVNVPIVPTPESTPGLIVSGGRGYVNLSSYINNTSSQKSSSGVSNISRPLQVGSVGGDVRALQVFLNNNGFYVAKNGPGSPGNETDTFGSLTKKALSDFQTAYAYYILRPSGYKTATGVLGPYTTKFIQDFNKNISN